MFGQFKVRHGVPFRSSGEADRTLLFLSRHGLILTLGERLGRPQSLQDTWEDMNLTQEIPVGSCTVKLRGCDGAGLSASQSRQQGSQNWYSISLHLSSRLL